MSLQQLKRLFSLLLTGGVVMAFCATATARFSPDEESPGSEQEKKLVYMRADRSYSIDVGDSMAVCMVGNFAAMHNGAVITCDSAVRYSGQYLECFGDVLINQNTTYIYGERAEYDGRINKAEVHSQLVKVIDGDATLYTRRFVFDTYTQVGEFSRGGVLFNRGNQLEAEHGYYLSDSHQIACKGSVEMRDSSYLLKSDSVCYNTDTDYAYFFRNTRIWNSDGDYLEGDEGYYARPEERYVITRRSYLLGRSNEMWSDSLDYHKPTEHILLHGNIQMDDTEQKALAFGDYGEYYREPGSALLTRNPALVNYDTSQGSDSLFMRSDSILLLTFYTTQPEFNPWEPGIKSLEETPLPAVEEKEADEEAAEEPAEEGAEEGTEEGTEEETETKSAEKAVTGLTSTPKSPTPKQEKSKQEKLTGLATGPEGGTTPRERNNNLDRFKPNRGLQGGADSTQLLDTLSQFRTEADSLTADTLTVDSAALQRQRLLDSLDTLSVKAQKAYYKGIKQQQRDSLKRAKLAAKNAKLQIIARARQAKITAQLNRMDSIEKVRLERRRARMAERLEAKRQKAIRRGKELPDSTALSQLDSMIVAHDRSDSLVVDSLSLDSLAVDSLSLDSLRADSLEVIPDSTRRLTKGYRNVRIYRTDFQAACDSLIGLGSDSTLHLYLNPILWSQQNQVTSEVMDVYTKMQAIDHVDFTGRPILVTQIDTMYYNQISGKEMTAWFAGNQIYRHDVNGNVETLYFLQDSPEEPVNSLFVIKSGKASFYMENQQVVSMTYREQNEYSMMPMDKIPPTQELFLKEYKWMPERRPARDSVLGRTIRPSERKAKESLSRPRFQRSEQILRLRDNLVESGKWADRDERLAPDVQEWVRRNGFEPEQPRKEFK